eukprot:TRINITY_DN15130_c0_g1_i1.p1 TRINITY_DN15130_c0_g1~~TRINITY_DN15130_c0_g1_i1.p1  ORF type:complete len:173 (+),score=30.45 TRINITY_DN15130_c0_g1_i1:91-609(+)
MCILCNGITATWKGKKWADMTDEEVEAYNKTLTWWPYIIMAALLAFIWIPEYTKFVWHLRFRFWVHRLYWRVMLPKSEADAVIHEAARGVPPAERTVQNPLAACPIPESERQNSEQLRQAVASGALPSGHPGSHLKAPNNEPIEGPSPFAQGVIQAHENLYEAQHSKADKGA